MVVGACTFFSESHVVDIILDILTVYSFDIVHLLRVVPQIVQLLLDFFICVVHVLFADLLRLDFTLIVVALVLICGVARLALELVKEAHIILCGTLGEAFTAVVYDEDFAVLVNHIAMVKGSVVVDQVRVTVLLSIEPSRGQI